MSVQSSVSVQESQESMSWSAPFEELSVGQRFASPARPVRDTDVIVFCALTGDWHPQHCDPQWAADSPFGERIAHGMLILSLAVGLVPLDPQRVLALRRVSDVVFKRPVRFEEAIHVAGEIAALRSIDERSGLVDFSWRISNQDDALVARAAVQVLWRRAAAPGEPASPLAADDPVSWQEPITGGRPRGEFVPLPL